MSKNKSLCEQYPGMCLKQADCPDVSCPGRAEGIERDRVMARLQCEIADENCRTLIEVRAIQVMSDQGQPVYDTTKLEPWQIKDEDMLATRQRDLVRAVRYLEMRGLLVRPIAGKPHFVSFRDGA